MPTDLQGTTSSEPADVPIETSYCFVTLYSESVHVTSGNSVVETDHLSVDAVSDRTADAGWLAWGVGLNPWHPDKHPTNPAATRRFRILTLRLFSLRRKSEAYCDETLEAAQCTNAKNDPSPEPSACATAASISLAVFSSLALAAVDRLGVDQPTI